MSCDQVTVHKARWDEQTIVTPDLTTTGYLYYACILCACMVRCRAVCCDLVMMISEQQKQVPRGPQTCSVNEFLVHDTLPPSVCIVTQREGHTTDIPSSFCGNDYVMNGQT